MRYFWTLFWSLLLSHMVVYVAGSMNGTGYDFTQGTFAGIIFAVIISVLGDTLVPEES